MKTHEIQIPLEALENGYFLVGVRAAANAMNNFHKRLSAVRLARAIDSHSRPFMTELNDMVRTFGKPNARGVVEVTPTNLSKKDAEEWDRVYSEWKKKAITFTSDLVVDGVIKFELSKSEADKFPTICLEAMDGIVEILVNDESEIQSLKNEIGQLKAQLSASTKD